MQDLIEVECCSGFGAEELPLRFLWRGRWIEVEEVLNRKKQGNGDQRVVVSRIFKVADERGDEYVLSHDCCLDLWYLSRHWS